MSERITLSDTFSLGAPLPLSADPGIRKAVVGPQADLAGVSVYIVERNLRQRRVPEATQGEAPGRNGNRAVRRTAWSGGPSLVLLSGFVGWRIRSRARWARLAAWLPGRLRHAWRN